MLMMWSFWLHPLQHCMRLMLHCCEDFASKHGLRFNPSKMQLIRFSWSSSSSCKASFTFCGQQLSFVDTVTHLGHLLHYNLSDVPDINHRLRDMVKKANCLVAFFPCVGPFLLTRLFQSYCLSLYGPALWTLSCPALHSSRSLSTGCCAAFGAFPIVVTPELLIWLPISTVFLI